MATGDFNKDGIPDLVVASYCGYAPIGSYCAVGGTSPGELTVFLGLGDGTFAPGVVYPMTGQYNTAFVAVGDIDGDGNQDLVASNNCYDGSCHASLSVLYGNGDGTFVAPYSFGTADVYGEEVVIGDFSGHAAKNDHLLDLAVVNEVGGCNGSNFTLVINQGGRVLSLYNQVNNGICGEQYYGMDAGDVTGDGIPDLVMSGRNGDGSQGVRVWTGNGDGTFNSAGFYSVGDTGPYNVKLADLNGDGLKDIVLSYQCGVSYCPEGSVGVLLATGGGGFQPMQVYITGPGTAGTAVGDLNNDNLPDILAGNADGSVSVLLNQGGGSFATPVSYYVGLNYLDQGVVADFNQDGKNDVAFVDQCVDAACINRYGTVSIAFGAGDGTFPEFQGTSVGTYLESVAVADVNGDGKPDVLVANYCGAVCNTGAVSVLLGQGNGTFAAPVSYSSGGYGALSVAVGDVNGDGKADLVVTNGCSSPGNCVNGGLVSLLLGNGDGTFQAAVSYGSGGTAPRSPVVADVNGDGKPDLLFANQCVIVSCNVAGNIAGEVGILLQNPDGTFPASAQIYYSGGNYALSLQVGDVNEDGKPDVMVGNENGFVGVLLGNGDGTFQPAVSYAAGFNSPSLALTDLNRDGKPDLLVASSLSAGGVGDGSLSVLLGNGDGTFQPAVAYDTGATETTSVSAGDVNGDGKTDAVVSNYCPGCTNSSISVLLGNGDGTLQTPQMYVVSVDSNIVTLGDLNADGKLDAVVASQCQNTSYCSNDGILALRNLFAAPAATTTVITPPTTSGVAFQPVTVTGSVTSTLAGAPTGSISFTSDGVPLGGAIVNASGQATLTTSALGAGKHFIFSAYGGDTTYAPSNSYGTTVTVSQGQSATTVSSAPTPTIYGQPVTLTASVTSTYGAPTGAVTFLDSGLPIGSASLSGSTATLILTSLSVGTHSITAAYAGDTNFTGSTSSNAATQVVTQATSSTSLSGCVSSIVYGQSLTLTAVIAPQYGGTAMGAVTFYNGSAAIGTVFPSGNTAVLAVSTLNVPSNSLKAVFGGDSNLTGSTSGTCTQPVTQATTTTALATSKNPALTNQTVVLTATVTGQYGGAPSGSVTFKSGSTTLASTTIFNGVATLSTSFATAGSRSLTATYVGDVNDLGSTSSATTESVLAPPVTTTTKLTTSATPSMVGQSVTFTATLTSTYAPLPAGENVSFYDGTTLIGSGALSSGGVATFATSTLTAKTHTIKATYAGDAIFKTSSGTVSQVVSTDTTTTTLSATPSPSAYGQSVTLTAQVTTTGASTPTGTVTFKSGTTSLGNGTLNGSGVATLSTTKLGVGSDSLTATYNGDTSNGKSTSTVLTQTVNQAATTTTLASSLNPSTSGKSVTFTAVVSSPTTSVTGTVTFMDGTTTLGTGNIASGKASFATSTLSVGTHTITAVYGGTTNITGSTSAPLTQTVN